MIKKTNYLGHEVGVIFVEGLQDKDGEGYFRDFITLEADEVSSIHSTSKNGLYIAVANLCRRLEKQSFTALPVKWQICLTNAASEQILLFAYGFLLIEQGKRAKMFVASFMALPFFLRDESPEEMERHVQQGILNSVEDATGQTEFGALGNLCRKFHYYDYARTIDSLVLDPLAAAFFLPAALEDDD